MILKRPGQYQIVVNEEHDEIRCELPFHRHHGVQFYKPTAEASLHSNWQPTIANLRAPTPFRA